jgi:hypothetical protein
MVEERARRDVVDLHQARQCRAMLPEILLLEPVRFVTVNAQEFADEAAHPGVDLREQRA